MNLLNLLSPLLAASVLYILPVLVGRAVYGSFLLIARWMKKHHSEHAIHTHSLSLPFLVYFLLGNLFTYIFVLIIGYSLILFSGKEGITLEGLRMLTLSLLGISFIINLFVPRSDLKPVPYILPFLASVLLSIVTYVIWQWNSPYPFNWDLYEHQTLVNLMHSGRFSFVTSQLSDTFGFNGYSTFFHTLMALSQSVLTVDIFEYWHSISMLHNGLITLLAYFFAFTATKNKTIGYLSMLISAFMFDSTMTFTSLFFLPQTLTTTMFICIYTQLIAEIQKNKLPPVSIAILSLIVLFLSHYVIGTMAVGIYLCTYIYYRYEKIIHEKFNVMFIVEAGLFLGLCLIIFSSNIPLGFLNKGEGEFFTYSISSKFSIMQQTYGFLMLLLLPLGISTIIKLKHNILMFLLITTVGLMCLILAQLPYVLKFYVIGRFFVHLFMAAGLWLLIKNAKNVLLRAIIVIACIATFAILFIANSAYWKNYLTYRDMHTHISSFEIDAAKFLKTNYGNKDILLISDPSTQYILETLSHVNSPGGAYADQKVRQKLIEINNDTSTKNIANHLYEINDTLLPTQGKRLFVLSGRYFLWQQSSDTEKQAIYYNIWYPADLTFDNKKYIQQFIALNPQFRIVYENPTLVIIEVDR